MDEAPRAAGRRRASAEQKGPGRLPWWQMKRERLRWERRVGEKGSPESSHRSPTSAVKRSGSLLRGGEQGGWGVVRGGLRQSVSRMGAETDQALKRGALRTQDNYPQPAKWEENSRISQVLQACIFGFVWCGVFVFVFKT